MKHFKKAYSIKRNTIYRQIWGLSLGIGLFLSFSIINYTRVQAQSFPVTITADGATTFCAPGTVTLSAPLTQTGTTSQLAPGAGTASDCNCPAGYVAIGITGRTGFWLDQFSLVCQQLSPAGVLFGATVITTANGSSAGGSNAGPNLLPAGNVMVGAAVDYYTYMGADSYIESVGLKGHTPAFILANSNNPTTPSTATTLSGNQTATGSLGTQYAPNGSVITGMKSFDKTYSAGVQWIYTPIAQIMTSYLWSPGGQTTRSITVSTSNTYTLSASAGYGTGTASRVVTVNSTPVIPGSFVTSDPDVCRGNNNIPYSINAIANATSYAWSYSGAGATISGGTTNSVTVNFSGTSTSGNIVVNATNTCGTSSNLSIPVTVNTGVPANAPGATIAGSNAVCAGTSGVAYSVTAATGTPAASSYTWSYTTGTGATINGSGTNVTVNYGAGATSGTLNVVSTNACGNNTTVRTKNITVDAATPAAPASFVTSDPDVCRGNNNIPYSIAAVAGATSYNWNYSGNGETISNGTTTAVTVNFSNLATSGNMTVNASNACGTSSNLSMAVVVSTGTPANPPSATITGSNTVCTSQSGVGYSVTASSGTPAATSYTWTYTIGSGVTINGSTNSITVDYGAGATSGTLNVRSTNGCGSNATVRTRAITVNTLPAQPSVIATNNATPCNTSTGTTYSVTPVAGVTFGWVYSDAGSSFTGTNPITVAYTNGSSGTWTVTPSNACGTGTSTRTLNVSLQPLGRWLGTTSGVWSAAATTNWGCGSVPTASMDVVIPAGATNMPVIAAGYTANAKSFSIEPNASLTITANGGLNVAGDFDNSGTFTDNNIFTNSGKITFNGSLTQQTITGSTTFSNVTISNAAGVNIAATTGNATTINGILTLSNGVFATNDKLSQNLYNGAIAPGGLGTVTGAIRFFKTIWGDKYHYISMPVPTAGLTTAQWTDNVLIKSGSASNLYSYNEATPDSSQKVGWTAVAPGAALSPMTGYALYFPRYTYNTLVDVSSTFDNTITSVSIADLKNTPSTIPVAKPTSDGWNLLGNPFPSTLDWTLIAAADRVGLNNAVYAYDSRRMVYTSYAGGVSVNGGTQYIGSMQAFFVKVVSMAIPGNLTIRNAARVTSTLKDVWRTQGSSDKRLKLKVANGSYSDELVVRFKEAATEQFDSEFDGFKIINDAPNPSLFAYTAEANYCLNSLPTSLTEKTIPLQLNVASDTLCTWTADMSGFSSNETIILEDRLLGTAQNLSVSPTYTIQLKKGVYANRFFLQYSNKQSIVTGTQDGSTADGGIDIGAVQQNVVLLFTHQNPGDANIAVFDALGKKVYEAQNVSTASGRIDINLQDINNGIYIVKVQTPAAIRSQQVYLIK